METKYFTVFISLLTCTLAFEIGKVVTKLPTITDSSSNQYGYVMMTVVSIILVIVMMLVWAVDNLSNSGSMFNTIILRLTGYAMCFFAGALYANVAYQLGTGMGLSFEIFIIALTSIGQTITALRRA